jgi:site-specific DNA-methyltransferase (adenine-specific)
MQAGYREKECLSIPLHLAEQMRSSGWVHRQTLIWSKNTSGEIANSDTAPCTHEYILQMGKALKPGRPYFNCKPLKSSVLHYSPTSDPIHPCPFPIELASVLIEASSEPRQVVIDPFMGSGTTALAAQSLDRHFIGIELNPEYRQIALDRLGKTEALCC